MALPEDIGNLAKVPVVIFDRRQSPPAVVISNRPGTGVSLKTSKSRDEAVKIWARDETPMGLLSLQLDPWSHRYGGASNQGLSAPPIVRLASTNERGHGCAV
jgi:hypothetical protein